MASSGAIGSNNIIRFVNGLKSKSDEVRTSTAIELQRYVTTELREVS